MLAALGGGLLAVAVREAVAALPALAAWIARSGRPAAARGPRGLRADRGRTRRLALLAAAVLPTAALVALGPGPAPLFALAGPLAASWAVSARRARYRRAVEARLGSVATALADGSPSGGSVRAALAFAGEALDGPPAAELARVRVDLELGASTRLMRSATSARGSARRRSTRSARRS